MISALFFNEMLLDSGNWRTWDSPQVFAGVVALVVAFATRSIYLTVFADMGVFAFAQWLMV